VLTMAETDRFSIGRVQPYTGNEGDGSAAADPAGGATYSNSLTVRQQNSPAGTPAGRQVSLFRHNSTNFNGDNTAPSAVAPDFGSDATLRAPFEWLVHLDRRLVSPAELAHVAGVKPHELTHRFALPDANPPPAGLTARSPKFHLHDLQHPAFTTVAPGTFVEQAGPLNAAAATGTGNSPVYRALESLAIKPFIHDLPEGGRVPGKVNINMLWDESPPQPLGTGRSRVFDAILDPKPAGTPGPNSFTDADLTAIWQAIKQTRSPAWAPGSPPVAGMTHDEAPAPTPGVDRPFKSFGAAMFNGTPGIVGAWNSTDIADTLLRSRTLDGKSLFSRVEPPPTPGVPPLHPYQELEPLRKALNNLTTVSDTYMVVLTVGFFEVRQGFVAGNPADPPVLGKEVYDQVPGDLRSQFTAVIDRTQLGGLPANNPVVVARMAGGAFTPTPDGAHWIGELQAQIPPTAAGATTQAQLHAVVPSDPNNWNGTGIPPATSVGTFNPNRPDAPGSQFFLIAPNISSTNMQTIQVGGHYDGADWTIHAAFNGDTGVLAPTDLNMPDQKNQGTRFFINVGNQVELVEAFFDPSNAPWSFDPTNGVAKIFVRGLVNDPVTGNPNGQRSPTGIRRHEISVPVSNVILGSPGPPAAFNFRDPSQQSIIRYVGRLSPVP